MACRCQEARAELMARSLPGTCECRGLDLADFSSVRSFAAATRHTLQQHAQHLQLLINNAGHLYLQATTFLDHYILLGWLHDHSLPWKLSAQGHACMQASSGSPRAGGWTSSSG